MEILYLVFALVSIVFITDGMLLKTEQFQKLMAQVIKKRNVEGMIPLVSSFLVTTGVITLVWTAVAYILSEQLLVEVFILVYVVLVIISGVYLFMSLKKRY